ncbi:hypothetical protein H6G00_00895 [Leptolyngbya sp. FACHB-541]|uniref:hypothetical protein n=1 Tax=Leptolyngbya sp. FACHB-541 TaxID=2692810 RepID=UPI0016822340|nr:hypothetical protein [Leptolyngbya sp. FACHB-541]MBD1995185.1 hypothetical protein [Leptolyngbya sp. FACHB-541]
MLSVKDWLKLLATPIVETRELTVPLIVLATICLLIWKIGVPGWSEFGLNAFTEVMGIVVTIVFVDQLIRRQEQRRTLPLQVAAYEDVARLVGLIIRFWNSAFYESVPQTLPPLLIALWNDPSNRHVPQTPPPLTVEQLFSLESIDAIRMCLDLDSQPNVAPPRTWWKWLEQNDKEFRSRAEHILERHAATLDPEAYALVHRLLNDFLHTGTGIPMIETMKFVDQQNGFPRPHALAYYWSTRLQDLETIVKLNEWCIRKKIFFEKVGMDGLSSPVLKLHVSHLAVSPPCMIDPQKILECNLAAQVYWENCRQQAN